MFLMQKPPVLFGDGYQKSQSPLLFFTNIVLPISYVMQKQILTHPVYPVFLACDKTQQDFSNIFSGIKNG